MHRPPFQLTDACMKEVISEGLRIKDLRREGDATSLDTWEILIVPSGRGHRPFRTLVQLGDVDSAVRHAKFAAERKKGMVLSRAKLQTITYTQAKEWGLVAGFSVIETP